MIEGEKTSDELISQLNELKGSDKNKANHRNNTLMEGYKQKVGQIYVNTLTSSNYIKKLKEKNEPDFDNSKLK